MIGVTRKRGTSSSSVIGGREPHTAPYSLLMTDQVRTEESQRKNVSICRHFLKGDFSTPSMILINSGIAVNAECLVAKVESDEVRGAVKVRTA